MSLLFNVSTTSGRILVVDDDAGARDLIVSSLRADGHDVDSARGGSLLINPVPAQFESVFLGFLLPLKN